VECRKRLFTIFAQKYTELFKDMTKDECRNSAKYILEKNVIWGNALNLKTVDKNPQPIVFSEWSLVNGSMIKRRDYTLSGLIPGFLPSPGLFPEPDLFSDLGQEVFIPKPVREFPLIHFLRVADAEK
jgi:hypothetical protein